MPHTQLNNYLLGIMNERRKKCVISQHPEDGFSFSPHTELPLRSFHSLRKANPGQHEEAPLAYFLSGNQICLCPTGNAEVRVKAYKGLFQNEHFPQRRLEFSHMEIEPTLFHLTFFKWR